MSHDQKHFPLGDILSITTGRLVSRTEVDGVYRILNYMTSSDLFTHQLPRASTVCAPVLLSQHPQLRDVIVPKEFDDSAHVWRWLAEQEANYGATLPVASLNGDEYEVCNPIEELCDMVGPEKVFVVE